MGIIQAYKMAIKAIRSNKIRAFLTMLGVIIGVSSVIAAVAFAKGSTKSITDQLSTLGTQLITVNISFRNSNRDVAYDEFQNYVNENPDLIEGFSPELSGNVTLKNGTETATTTLIGTTADYTDVNDETIQQGRFLLDIDSTYRQNTVVVGTYIVNNLYNGENPIGQTLKINGHIFQVVGVMTETADGEEGTDDDRVFIPVTTAQRLLKISKITRYQVKSASADLTDTAVTSIENFLYGIYGSSDSYQVRNMADLLDTLNSVTGTMMAVLGGIAAISLIVGGIGIMNIMLVSVTERTREIGIRMAIGAKKRNIMMQFLIEALMVTGIGGILGVLLGMLATFAIGKIGIVPSVYSLQWSIFAFGISLFIGILFGLFPANKASKLKPIDALRFE